MKLKLARQREFWSERWNKKVEALPCVLVYYDGGLASMAALRAACGDFKAETRIVAVYMEMVSLLAETAAKRDDRAFTGKAVLAAAVVNAALYGRSIETLDLQVNARGLALVELAQAYGDSTIYMGTDPEHSDWLTDYMQAHAPANIVLVPLSI